MSPPFFWHALVGRRFYLSIGVYGVFFFLIFHRNEPAASPPSSANKAGFSIGKKTSQEKSRRAASHGLCVFASDFDHYVLRVIARLHAVVPSCKIDFARSESRCEHSATLFRNNYIIIRLAMCIEWENVKRTRWKVTIFVDLFCAVIGFCLSFACSNTINLQSFVYALFSQLACVLQYFRPFKLY